MLPIVLGMAPFGLLAGIAAVEAGLPAWGATVFSTVIFAGASQLAALDLIGDGATLGVVVGTVAIINTRFVMYSASLATRFGEEPLWRRAVMAYLLTDQAYAVTITKLEEEPRYGPRWAYFVGGALSLWAAWQGYTVMGAVAGQVVPEDVPIGFAVPLVFAALLVPAVTDRPTLVAALTSALVAVAAADLPFNLGLLLAAVAGITAGYVAAGPTADDPARPRGPDPR